MKTLLLMRHAKSSWKDKNLEDYLRPIKKRGQKNTARMAELLKEAELVPQLILCSSAVRARQTADALIPKSGFQGKIEYLDAFYMAESQVYIDAIRNLPDEIERVMLIGHNPGLEGCMQILSDRVESLSTASIAYLVLPVGQWSDLTEKTRSELIDIWQPHNLK